MAKANPFAKMAAKNTDKKPAKGGNPFGKAGAKPAKKGVPAMPFGKKKPGY